MLGQNKSIRYVQCVVVHVHNLPWLGLPHNQIHLVNFFCTFFGTICTFFLSLEFLYFLGGDEPVATLFVTDFLNRG